MKHGPATGSTSTRRLAYSTENCVVGFLLVLYQSGQDGTLRSHQRFPNRAVSSCMLTHVVLTYTVVIHNVVPVVCSNLGLSNRHRFPTWKYAVVAATSTLHRFCAGSLVGLIPANPTPPRWRLTCRALCPRAEEERKPEEPTPPRYSSLSMPPCHRHSLCTLLRTWPPCCPLLCSREQRKSPKSEEEACLHQRLSHLSEWVP